MQDMPRMEHVNVIRQGYLKRGSSTDGGMFSGFLDKIFPRKWYMLVVRNRVPFLEQYERDVDVFSSMPNTAYNLSTCTSVSHTMSSSSRNFTFVIVCPMELIELIAASREQMVDWCDAIERTLRGLGVFKNEKEEHIYSFCPAVVNLTGHSKARPDLEEEQEEEVLGAIGGAPAQLPLRQQAPPIPHDHPSALSRPSSDPVSALGSLSPTVAPPPPVRRSCSVATPAPDRVPGSSVAKAPSSPNSSARLSPVTSEVTSVPPPLPRGRPVISEKPPPLPPGRPIVPINTLQERSLPPLPVPPSIDTAQHHSNSSENEDEDDSSDFVSGAFWEINRKTPVPSAIYALVPPKPCAGEGNASASAGTCSGKDASADSALGASGSDVNVEDLDEGYSDLATVQDLKVENELDQTGASKSNDYTQANRCTDADFAEAERSADESELNSRTGSTAASSSEFVHSTSQFVAENDTDATYDNVVGVLGLETEQKPDQSGENFYAPFPGQSSNGPSSLEDEKDTSISPEVCLKSVSTSNHPKNIPRQNGNGPSSLEDDRDNSITVEVVHLKPKPNHQNSFKVSSVINAESDNMYACASEASSIPGRSVPPLPPRLDSLPTWKSDCVSDTNRNKVAAAATDGCSALDASVEKINMDQSESRVSRPTPHRRTIHNTSCQATEYEPDCKPSQGSEPVSDIQVPPLPPPRMGIESAPDQCIAKREHPAPLPVRKTQSFHIRRHMSASVADSAEHQQMRSSEIDSHQTPSHQSSLLRHQSFGNGDGSVAENHLRQRMRLDRVHSVHSVISLKRSQAEILQQEMDLPGVTVTVTARAALGIATVDCGDSVCIAGWNQKDFPSLHGKFHIGDQLISICNIKIISAVMAVKMLKHPEGDIVEMLVKRTPHAKVLAIRRVAEGQNIGIKRNGGTAEIQYVDPNGLAAENGLPLHAPSIMGGQGRSNWVLTEINSRHLNLFFKDNEIEHRLNAVGREITVVVQPCDYISEMKKQLKKMKNYKNYIVQ